MNKLMIAFAATLTLGTLGGCKKKVGADSSEAIAKTTEFKDAMCRCTDAPCVQKVDDDMTKWTQESAKKSNGPVQMSEADQKKYTEIGQQMGECKQKAMGATFAGSGSDMGSAAGSAAANAGSAAGSGSDAGSATTGSAATGSAAAGSGAEGSAAAGSGAAKKAEKKAGK